MKYYFLFILIIAFTSCSVQQKITTVKNKPIDLIGFVDKESFNHTPHSSWFTQKIETYKPNETTISLLKKELTNVTIKAVIGTWCGDSKREIPNFYKILELTNFDFKNLTLIAVNRSKTTPNNLQKGLDIIRVPTFIFYKEGKEIGRYVEYARESLEKDILKIITGKAYKHSYNNSK